MDYIAWDTLYGIGVNIRLFFQPIPDINGREYQQPSAYLEHLHIHACHV